MFKKFIITIIPSRYFSTLNTKMNIKANVASYLQRTFINSRNVFCAENVLIAKNHT